MQVWRNLTRNLTKTTPKNQDAISISFNIARFLHKQLNFFELERFNIYDQIFVMTKYLPNVTVQCFKGRNLSPLMIFRNGRQYQEENPPPPTGASSIDEVLLTKCFKLDDCDFYIDYLRSYFCPLSPIYINLYMGKHANISLHATKTIVTLLKDIRPALGFRSKCKHCKEPLRGQTHKCCKVNKPFRCVYCKREKCFYSLDEQVSCFVCRITFMNLTCFALHRGKYKHV